MSSDIRNRPLLLPHGPYATGSAGVSHPFTSSMWFRAEFKPFTCFASNVEVSPWHGFFALLVG
jgi:hypothetical protein